MRVENCTVGIVGLGLMGGAVALALRPLKPGRLLAWDIDKKAITTALAEGLIDEGWCSDSKASPLPGNCRIAPQHEMLGRCDLVYLCINPSTLLRFMDSWMGAFKSGALITDIAGIKGAIVSAMEQTLRDDLDFIPGHPMAGSEKGGFAHAKQCNFRGKNYILTPLKRNKPENLAFLKDLIYRMGFSRITETTPQDHDRKIAFTSQLCHVIAAALIDCETDTEITRFGGGSFEDLTRIAMLNAPMWTELFLENQEELLARIAQFEGSLDTLKTLIAGGRRTELEERLLTVRERRGKMS